MANTRRGSRRSRLASLEHRAQQARDRVCQRTVIYLPVKDGDTRPPGVISQTGGVLTVLYRPGEPDPPLPEGW